MRRRSQPSGAAWIVSLGDEPEVPASKVLGRQTQEVTGPGWRLSWRIGPDETIRVDRSDVRTVLTLGDPARSGSKVAVSHREGVAPGLEVSVDPFGLHGAFAASNARSAWCGSSPQIVRMAAERGTELDPEAVHGYLCFSYVPSPLTPFAGIKPLPAGSNWRCEEGAGEIRQAPMWPERRAGLSEAEAVTELRRLLLDSVKRCLDTDTEAAVFLSGGLDSSLIAASLVSIGVRVRLFTLDFGDPYNLEVEFAEEVAAHLNLPVQRVPAGPREIRRALNQTAAAMTQPYGDGVTVPLYLLGKAASQDCGLVFNGEGGDQLFGGWANKPVLASKLYGESGDEREDTYLATFHRFHGETDDLYTPRARKQVGLQDEGRWIRDALQPSGHPSLIHRLRAANLRLKGAQNIAPRCVQLASAHGMRVAAPLFDPDLTDWTFTLPPELLLAGATEKHLLKLVAASYLPERIVWREKRGMGVPLTDWLEGPLRWEVRRRLSPLRLLRDGWFDARAVMRLASGREPRGDLRRRRTGEKLWALLMLHAWMDAQDPPLRFPK